jgi:hypothetical protein
LLLLQIRLAYLQRITVKLGLPPPEVLAELRIQLAQAQSLVAIKLSANSPLGKRDCQHRHNKSFEIQTVL